MKVKGEEENGLEQRHPLPSEITNAFNPSHTRRLLVILAFPLILLLGAPIWWYTTSIERLPLPRERIAALESAIPVDSRSNIVFTADNEAFPAPAAGRPKHSSKDILLHLAEEVTKSVDGLLGQAGPATRRRRHWDLLVGQGKSSRSPLRVHIKVSNRANTSFPLRPYVQAAEVGSFGDNPRPGTLVVPVHPSQVGDRHLPIHYKMAISDALVALLPPYRTPPTVPLRALKYAPNITLSFVVLNEDSTEGSFVQSWDISSAINDHILPHLEPLKDIFKFDIESQILYHAPLTFEPHLGAHSADTHPSVGGVMPDEEGIVDLATVRNEDIHNPYWYIGEEEMKIFINSESWSLDSGSTNNPVLRMLLYVPNVKHRPMRTSVSDARSFLIPQYGAVVLLNPPSSTFTNLHLPLAALHAPFHLFTQHLYSLLDLPSIPSGIAPSPPSSHLVPERPFAQPLTPWQVEHIMRVRARENSLEARRTLSGISRLVSKIKEMKVGKGVRDKVQGAVERLEKMDKTRDTRQAFILSRDAAALASQAFFDPSMMGLLYFPDEHKFAVYTPLFAPIAVPMIVAILRELLAWRKRRKTQKSQKEAPAVSTSLNSEMPEDSMDDQNSKNVNDQESASIFERSQGDRESRQSSAPADDRSDIDDGVESVLLISEVGHRSRGGHNLRSRASLHSPSSR
ncbi:phosphatidylinositol-glycan biosynthesis class S protein [Kockovaella imperatae]|uniref:Phosphatidylinositol-glycan biosynthesis class S protein n=1 Tax=Kockovaella imperatae TaxID=4999 RepID=A0A1Y1UP64_9TREE|nr:phosphatidylinositol-glycan biosynthesis class S protein [Kockovaella imperatae]ORX39337.1 phosphatidylinositol-glycan biosynthesis class S protein [Kockovaella imperatae]